MVVIDRFRGWRFRLSLSSVNQSLVCLDLPLLSDSLENLLSMMNSSNLARWFNLVGARIAALHAAVLQLALLKMNSSVSKVL